MMLLLSYWFLFDVLFENKAACSVDRWVNRAFCEGMRSENQILLESLNLVRKVKVRAWKMSNVGVIFRDRNS